jgi:hypothetical protein
VPGADWAAKPCDDCVRQTGGSWRVVSLHAKGDADAHASSMAIRP